MTNEEIIKELTKMLNNTIEANECGLSNNDFKDDIELLKSALSLIEKQQEEIENTKELYDRALSDLVKADKQIDLMAERIEWLCKSNGILLDKEHDENFTQEDVKQYFERKVEDVKD